MSEEHNQDMGYEEIDKALMLAYETKKKISFLKLKFTELENKAKSMILKMFLKTFSRIPVCF